MLSSLAEYEELNDCLGGKSAQQSKSQTMPNKCELMFVSELSLCTYILFIYLF